LKENYTACAGNNDKNYTHTLRVKAPQLGKNEALCIIGNCEELGNWSVDKPLLLSNKNYPLWTIDLDLSKVNTEIHYKYGVYNTEGKYFKCFEYGQDRIVPPAGGTRMVVVNDTFVRLDSNTWHGAGVGIPVFSLRSKKSFGCGDFSDLKLMVDWAQRVGLKLIQVLPLNDTIGTHTEADVLPYAAISAFALNPLFLDLSKLDMPKKDAIVEEYKRLQPIYNAEERMDFLNVVNFKLRYIEAAYKHNKDKFLASEDFKQFFKDNEHWLKPYSIYCCIRDQRGTCDYRQWNEFAVYSEKKADELTHTSHP
jgi:4-alpha-glucanotransferase